MVFRKSDGSIDWILSSVVTLITALIIWNFSQTNRNTIETAELKIKVVNMEKNINEIKEDVKYLVRLKDEKK